jgi:solute carrier family 25 2-oxodicarboxylate transporter 21
MVYFGLYHSMKQKYPPPQDSSANLAYRFAVGLAAGTLASISNIPFDVAKSRIQGPQPQSGRKYFSAIQSMGLIYREEGFLALYKGLLPKIMRLGPGGAILLIVYESVYDWLKKTF